MTPVVDPFPARTFQDRRERALERLGHAAMVLPASPVRFSSRDTEYRYRPDSELYYLTGLTEPGSVAVLRGHADEDRFVIFTRPNDEEAELWQGPRLGPDAARERTGADAAFRLGEIEERLPPLLKGADHVHFRLGSGSDCEGLVVRALAESRARGARRGEGPWGVIDPGTVLDDMRLRKDADEITRMRTAAEITSRAHRVAMGMAHPGRGEWEVEAALEAAFRSSGADGPAFGTIVGSGRNACVLHYVENVDRLRSGDLTLIDAGAAVGLYAGDVTRTFPVSARFSAPQRVVYDIVESARAAAVEAIEPGASVAGVQEAAVRVLVEGLVAAGVLEGDPEELRASDAYKPYFPHRVSHWLGLDVHDPGDYAKGDESRILEAGMVLTVEPGLYFGEGVTGGAEAFGGIGVRIEDDVLVTDEGYEVLSQGVPTEPAKIEELVGSGGAGD